MNTKLLVICLLSIGLMGCIVKPNVETQYDNTCNVKKRHITLSVEEVEVFSGSVCRSNHSCKAQLVEQLASSTVILPISAIISGSIALIGNTLFWLQESNC